MKRPFFLLAFLVLLCLSTALRLGSISKAKVTKNSDTKDKTLGVQNAGTAKAKKPKVNDHHAGCKGEGKCGSDGMCWLSKKQNTYGHKCTAPAADNLCTWNVKKLSKTTTQARTGYACTAGIKSKKDVDAAKTFMDSKEVEDGRKHGSKVGSSDGKKLLRSHGSSSSSGNSAFSNYKAPKDDADSKQTKTNDQQQKKGWLW